MDWPVITFRRCQASVMDTERGWIHCHSPADYFCRYNTGKLRRICDECFTINNDIIVEVLTEEEYEIALIMEE